MSRWRGPKLTTDEMLQAVAAAEEREDWRGLSGLQISGRNSRSGIHNSTAQLLEKGGLVRIQAVTYQAEEDRVFLTAEGRATLHKQARQ